MESKNPRNNNEQYLSFGQRGNLGLEEMERATQLLYDYWQMLEGKRKARREARAPAPRQQAFSAEEVYLADVWLAQRMARWQAVGRINRFGYLKPLPMRGHLTLHEVRIAFPNISIRIIRKVHAYLYPAQSAQVPQAPAQTMPAPPPAGGSL